jgi:DNA helicase II / ATP-dependent DNA helicase PcrA
MSFKPTAQQEAIISALVDTDDNLAVIARAGCGKTSTILLCVDAVVRKNPTAEILVCAFNKAIANEVSEKLKSAGHNDWRRIQASTVHSMGFGLLKFAFKSEIDETKVFQLIRAKFERENGEPDRSSDYYLFKAHIAKLVGLGKREGVGFFPDAQVRDASVWYRIADHYDMNDLKDPTDMDTVVACAQVIYAESLAKTDVVDFDDMILFPLVKNLRVKFTKDLIFIDEAQDLSRARQALISKFVKPGTGRVVIVGDDKQAIYGFTGAENNALQNMCDHYDAFVLPLSVTWRCPSSVVAVANSIVPDIMAAPEAPVGEVLHMVGLPTDLKPGDAILCRNVAPLIAGCYKLIREGKTAKVEGRAIGQGLKVLAQRWKIETIDDLLVQLETYQQREVQKFIAQDRERQAEEVADKCDTLREICNECLKQKKAMISDAVWMIEELFADDAKRAIIFASYHRSKGREWDRVILMDHYLRCPSKFAKQAWQKAQENNLAYVAITRAKHTLVFADMPRER